MAAKKTAAKPESAQENPPAGEQPDGGEDAMEAKLAAAAKAAKDASSGQAVKTAAAKSEYEHHPMAAIFPMLQEKELSLLVDSIKAVGQKEPIWLADGKILDGRNREAACLIAGVEPRYKEIPEQHDLLEFLLACNLTRRQMDASQRAIAAAKLEGYPHGGVRKPENRETLLSLKDLSTRFRVSQTYIKNARNVLAQCDPAVTAAVEEGHIAVNDAATKFVLIAPQEMQAEAVKEAVRYNRTLVESLHDLCVAEDMEKKRQEAKAKHQAAEAERQREEHRQLLEAEGLTEDEYVRKQEEFEEARKAAFVESEATRQKEFEALDATNPIDPLPFLGEDGKPAVVDDIWDAAASFITKQQDSYRQVYIASDGHQLLFFRSAANQQKFLKNQK